MTSLDHTVAVGDTLPTLSQASSLVTSVRYAGASGDLNPLHYDPAFAAEVSPTGDVITHGMYAMGLASRLLTDWSGGPEHVTAIDVRFSRPWPLGTTATFTGTVREVTDDLVTVRLVGTNDDTGDTVLRGTATVRR